MSITSRLNGPAKAIRIRGSKLGSNISSGKIVIIGGNAAGLPAASRAKRVDPRLKVTVLEKGPYISYSTCGIPYYFAKMVTAERPGVVHAGVFREGAGNQGSQSHAGRRNRALAKAGDGNANRYG